MQSGGLLWEEELLPTVFEGHHPNDASGRTSPRSIGCGNLTQSTRSSICCLCEPVRAAILLSITGGLVLLFFGWRAEVCACSLQVRILRQLEPNDAPNDYQPPGGTSKPSSVAMATISPPKKAASQCLLTLQWEFHCDVSSDEEKAERKGNSTGEK